MDGKLDFEPSVVVNSFNSGFRLIYRDFRKRKAKSPVLLPQLGGSVVTPSLSLWWRQSDRWFLKMATFFSVMARTEVDFYIDWTEWHEANKELEETAVSVYRETSSKKNIVYILILLFSLVKLFKTLYFMSYVLE